MSDMSQKLGTSMTFSGAHPVFENSYYDRYFKFQFSNFGCEGEIFIARRIAMAEWTISECVLIVVNVKC